MTVDVAIVNTFEVSTESETLHPAKKIRVIGKSVFERTILLVGLAHEDAPAFLYYLRFNDSRVISEIGDITLTFEDCLHCFMVAIGA